MTRARGAARRGRRASAPRGRGPGSIRISGGRWKGRSLEVPPAARPTSARAREALFDILGPRLAGSRWLELYAGSGAVGLEAVSRGAVRAVLVDSDASVLARNAARLGADRGVVRVLAADAAEGLASLERAGESFDVVFADPPYASAAPPGLLARAASLLAADGLLVVQTGPDAAPEIPPRLALDASRAYGRNVFWFARAGPRGTGPF